MSEYIFSPPTVESLPIVGHEERFPVRRLFFVGRNYHAHAVEMGRPVFALSSIRWNPCVM